jgi:hypothetical protein
MNFPYLTINDLIISQEEKEIESQYSYGDFIYINSLRSNNIDLEIEIQNSNDYTVIGSIIESFGHEKQELLKYIIIPPNSKETFNITLTYFYILNESHITLEFYKLEVNNTYNVNKKLFIQVNPIVENLIIEERRLYKRSYYEKITINKQGNYITSDPRIMGIYSKMRRNIEMFMRLRNANRRKFLWFSTRLSGSSCPYCTYNSSVLDRKNYLFEEEKYINYNEAKSFCLHCFGTTYLGGFYGIKSFYAFFTYGTFKTPEGGLVKTGNIITPGDTPIKTGDYIFDGNNLFYISSEIEINTFFDLPVYFRASVINVSPLSPLNVLIKNFSNTLKNIFDYDKI